MKERLFKIENDDLSKKLKYLFHLSVNGNNWKAKYKARCSVNEDTPIDQDDLSDYEYFIKTHPIIEDSGDISHYYLLIDNEPVTYITLTMDSTGLVDITYTTPKKFASNGYATKSVQLLEEMLFSDSNVRGIKLLDHFSTGGATTKIAIKAGFQDAGEDGLLFVKMNPNYETNKSKHNL